MILFLFGLQMVFGTGIAAPPEPSVELVDVAVFPLALPTIAGPGAIMAVVLLTDNHRHSLPEQAVTAGVLLFVLALNLVVLLLAAPIHRRLGEAGTTMVVRVMGLLLVSLAAEQVVLGLEKVLQTVGDV